MVANPPLHRIGRRATPTAARPTTRERQSWNSRWRMAVSRRTTWRLCIVGGRRSPACRPGRSSTFEMTDGRSLVMTHQPMEGGWLATYEDITERRRRRQDGPHGPPRRADRSAEPGAVPRDAGRRAGAARPVTFCVALSRSRPVQGGERHARPSGRRRFAAGGAQRLRDAACAIPTPLRGSAATNSPSCRRRSIDRPRPTDFAERLIEMLDEPFDDRRSSDRHRHQHRHRVRAAGWSGRRRVAEERRSRAVPRQVTTGAAYTGCSRPAWTPRCRCGDCWNSICGRRCAAVSSKCTISR